MNERLSFERELELLLPAEFETPTANAQAVPKGLHLFDHWAQPMKPNSATEKWVRDGAEGKLQPLNPGFLDASGEIIVKPLQAALEKLIADDVTLRKYLAPGVAQRRKPAAADRIRIAVVDLTGPKILKPEYAGWGSTVAVAGASTLKVLPLYAAFQLLHDLKRMAAVDAITTAKELIAAARKAKLPIPPVTSGFLDPDADPPDLKLNPRVLAAMGLLLSHNQANHAARQLIEWVGFPYIASLMWQSGLWRPGRGGLWLTSSYELIRWNNPIRPAPAPAFGHNATALGLATFFTLLAQRRLVTPEASDAIQGKLRNTSWFRQVKELETAATVSKVGLLTRCLKKEPKLRDGKAVLDAKGNPVTVCVKSETSHAHEAGLVEIDGRRYVVALLTVGIPEGISVLKKLVLAIDGLIKANNP